MSRSVEVLMPGRDAAGVGSVLSAFAGPGSFALINPAAPSAEKESLLQRIRSAPSIASGSAVFFTSGTSGRPKGVVLGRSALLFAAEVSGRALDLSPTDRWLLCLPLCHIGGFSILSRCRLRGAQAIIGPERFDPQEVSRQIGADRISIVSLVPTMLERLLRDPEWRAPPTLRLALLGGAPISAALIERAAERGLSVRSSYGMTESSAMCVLDGNPLEGTEVRIRDGRALLRGPQMLSGYLDSEGGPDEHGWFDTRDRGRLDGDARLQIEGRADELIITGGENVSPREVEAALRSIPGVSDCSVYGVPDPEWGQAVAAEVVARGLTSDSLLGALRPKLSPYKLPKRLSFVEQLPPRRPDTFKRG